MPYFRLSKVNTGLTLSLVVENENTVSGVFNVEISGEYGMIFSESNTLAAAATNSDTITIPTSIGNEVNLILDLSASFAADPESDFNYNGSVVFFRDSQNFTLPLLDITASSSGDDVIIKDATLNYEYFDEKLTTPLVVPSGVTLPSPSAGDVIVVDANGVSGIYSAKLESFYLKILSLSEGRVIVEDNGKRTVTKTVELPLVISLSTCKKLTEVALCYLDKYNRNCVTEADTQVMTLINALQSGITSALSCGNREDALALAEKLESLLMTKCC